ncbi:MAG: hypothetical protein LBN39_09895, partial [Planctomycetaceae bacterium]|nr:hypothetical protein [Planctomycetaceae bacterium]
NEVDAFYQKAGEYLDNTQNRWKDIGVFQESFQKYSSVSGIWKQRKEIFKKMLEDLQAGIRKYRYTAEWSQRSNAFYFYFFFSGWAFVPCVNPALILPRCFITSRRGRYCGVCAAAAVLAGLLCRMLS